MSRSAFALGLAFALAAATAAHAGPAADDVSRCLAAKMSDADRTTLVTWLWEEMGAHPALKPMVSLTDAQRADARKAAAGLAQRLITEDCRAEAAAAIRNEGPGVLQKVFWGAAQQSIDTVARDPAVLASAQQVGQYFDMAKLAAIMRDPTTGQK